MNITRQGSFFSWAIVSVVSTLVLAGQVHSQVGASNDQTPTRVASVLQRIERHNFHPIRGGFTYDRQLNKHGVADYADTDWLVRTLAVRDLIRLGPTAKTALITSLTNANPHVRHVSVMAMGILRCTNATTALERTLREDSDDVVRSQAAIALSQIGLRSSLDVLRTAKAEDKSRDVTHQAELAIHAIEHGHKATPELATAWRGLDETRFGKVKVGELAPDFELPDTEGQNWRLADFRGKKPVVLIWIFADWCPVCHGEFRELIELRHRFEAIGAQVFTLQAHDVFPARVMVGKELEPKYWFSKTSFKDSYTKNIWWPHLVDRAGAVGAEYGAQPLAFVVHAEWINRPSVAIVDKEGIVKFAYYGTYWGDRPSIKQLLTMLERDEYRFDAPRRLKSADAQ